MITRDANAVMADIHNDGPNKHRMPLFLAEDLEKLRLSDDLSNDDMRAIFHYEINPKDLIYHPVYTLKGYHNRPNDKHRYEPFDWEGLHQLGNDKFFENILF